MFYLSQKDRGLLHSVLNETLHGFRLPDIDNVIGIKKTELRELLERLHMAPRDARLELNRVQTFAFRNALTETLRELGPEDFTIRTGWDFEDAKRILVELDRILTST